MKRVRGIAGSPWAQLSYRPFLLLTLELYAECRVSERSRCAFNSQEAAQSSRRNLLYCRERSYSFVTTAKPTPLLLVKRLQVKPNQISSLLHQFQHRNGHRLDAGAQRGLGQWLEEG